MAMPTVGTVFYLNDFDDLGFHDCYVHGLRWVGQSHAFIVDLDYIVQWVEKKGKYCFLVARAEAKFSPATDLKISLDWRRLPLEGQIQDIVREHSGANQHKNDCYLWTINFSVPSGYITFESPHFELKILSEPQETYTQHLR